MDGVVHTTACVSLSGGRGAAIVRGFALSGGDDLRGDQSGILRPDLIGDQDRLLGTVMAAERADSLVCDLGDGHHAFDHAAVLGAVNALRWRFDRAFRAAFGH